jgi:tRNA pseudouridine13 synthase
LPELPEWERAFGPVLLAGRIRTTPDDFNVVEELNIEFAHEGEHDWLRIRKTGANTHWVAGRLAKFGGVPGRDVGYSGLKDRHAITEQWFSVQRKPGVDTDWGAFAAEGVEILEQRRHRRKLRRGTHRSNRFRIAVRAEGLAALSSDIDERLELIAARGVPNYFGEQRFGRDGANIALGQAVVDGRRVPRHKRSLGLSALRSLRFNEELDGRVRDGSWETLRVGGTANLDGTGSVFEVEEITPELRQRCAELDIHPCGTLPALGEAGVAEAWRPLRMRVADLRCNIDRDALWLEFTLGRGCYATAVLREIASVS